MAFFKDRIRLELDSSRLEAIPSINWQSATQPKTENSVPDTGVLSVSDADHNHLTLIPSKAHVDGQIVTK